MSLVNKVFEIISDDEELQMQFPELKKGVVFKVVTVAERDRDYEDGITSVKIKNGPYLHVNGRDSWFWCFYCEDTMDQLKEIEELASDMFPEVPTGMFDGLPIVERLDAIVDELGGYNANLVIAAIDYIKKLEKQLEFSDRAF
ncbi:inhibitor of host Lon protease [Enterobacter phage vB_EhoM-IME523]|uniref:Inhibitor of host Lon protease n=1 Tax=Enterobacter phage vB_EhoM-IME523 TaxID=2596709 RepID=A0A7G3KCK4_9CAUD|nr:inhibitor of host Lon protease [Enterobacter phage vB_EhoM-IME523]QEA10556.1 inhibitor of host Lon protease [Enterobacter phage vB_EhoM-IME523]